VAALGLQPTTFVGAAEQAVQQVASKLDKFALHFAFLDPYNLNDLPFSILTPPPFASYPANRCSGR